MSEKKIIKDDTSMTSDLVIAGGDSPFSLMYCPIGKLRLEGYSKEDIVKINQYLEYKDEGDNEWKKTIIKVYPGDGLSEDMIGNSLSMFDELSEGKYINFYFGSDLVQRFKPNDLREDYSVIGRRSRTACDILTSDGKEWHFVFSNLKIGSIDGSNENMIAIPVGCGERCNPAIDENIFDERVFIADEYLDEDRDFEFTFSLVTGSVDPYQSTIELIICPIIVTMNSEGYFSKLESKTKFTVPVDDFVYDEGITRGTAKINLNFGTKMFPDYDEDDPLTMCGYTLLLHTITNSVNGSSIHCFGGSGQTPGWERFEEFFPEIPISDLLIVAGYPTM